MGTHVKAETWFLLSGKQIPGNTENIVFIWDMFLLSPTNMLEWRNNKKGSRRELKRVPICAGEIGVISFSSFCACPKSKEKGEHMINNEPYFLGSSEH